MQYLESSHIFERNYLKKTINKLRMPDDIIKAKSSAFSIKLKIYIPKHQNIIFYLNRII